MKGLASSQSCFRFVFFKTTFSLKGVLHRNTNQSASFLQRFPCQWQGWCHLFPQGWCHRFPQGWCHRFPQGWCHRFPQGWWEWLEEHLHNNIKNESVYALSCSLWGHDLFACPIFFRFLCVLLEAAFIVAVSVQCQSAKLKPRFVAGGVCLWLQCQSAKLKPRFNAGGVCLWLQCQSTKLKPRFVAGGACLWLHCQSAKLKPRFVAGGVCLWLRTRRAVVCTGHDRRQSTERQATLLVSSPASLSPPPPHPPPPPRLI